MQTGNDIFGDSQIGNKEGIVECFTEGHKIFEVGILGDSQTGCTGVVLKSVKCLVHEIFGGKGAQLDSARDFNPTFGIERSQEGTHRVGFGLHGVEANVDLIDVQVGMSKGEKYAGVSIGEELQVSKTLLLFLHSLSTDNFVQGCGWA